MEKCFSFKAQGTYLYYAFLSSFPTAATISEAPLVVVLVQTASAAVGILSLILSNHIQQFYTTQCLKYWQPLGASSIVVLPVLLPSSDGAAMVGLFLFSLNKEGLVYTRFKNFTNNMNLRYFIAEGISLLALLFIFQ